MNGAMKGLAFGVGVVALIGALLWAGRWLAYLRLHGTITMASLGLIAAVVTLVVSAGVGWYVQHAGEKAKADFERRMDGKP